MGDSAVLQKIRSTAPKVISDVTSHTEIEKKNCKNCLTRLGIELTTYQFQNHNFDYNVSNKNFIIS